MARDYMPLVEAYLRHCFANRSSPRVDELAHMMKEHPSALSRKFHAQTGCHLSAVMKTRQINEAKRLLATTDMTAASVALSAGFGTVNTLFRVFRTHVGITPQEYRRTSDKSRA